MVTMERICMLITKNVKSSASKGVKEGVLEAVGIHYSNPPRPGNRDAADVRREN